MSGPGDAHDGDERIEDDLGPPPAPEDRFEVSDLPIEDAPAIPGAAQSADVSPFDRATPLRKLMIAVFILLFTGLTMSSIITVAIWPGEMKLTAPLFCPEAQSEAVVVSDTETSGGETTTNFSLYCLGPRGDTTEVGFVRPFFLLSAVHGVAIWLLVLFSSGLGGRGHLRRSRGGPQEVAEVQGGFVPPIIADQ